MLLTLLATHFFLMNNLFPKRYLIWSVIACVLFAPLGIIPLVLSILALIEAKSDQPDEVKIFKLKKWITVTVILSLVVYIAVVIKILLSIWAL